MGRGISLIKRRKHNNSYGANSNPFAFGAGDEGSIPSARASVHGVVVAHRKTHRDTHMKNINNFEKVPSTKKVASTNKLINNLYVNTSLGRTENNALTYTRSGSALLDFFAQAGAMRPRPDKALDLFKKAYAEDHVKAVKLLFYLRDIRGGQGERTLFRNCLQWLGETHPTVFEGIVRYVAEYGRWDDMFFDNDTCFQAISAQLEKDMFSSGEVSLLAKWLPTINASSPTTRAKARFIAQNIGMREIEYRKNIRDLRHRINIVEKQMSNREWGGINYSSVPSQAARIYRNAFRRHDEARYGAFIDSVQKGEETMKAATLYPYQIYKSAMSDYSKALDALWKSLPDYTQGNNALVIADVSGSMYGDPLSVSVSLALYFAERNTGQFKDHFITFSESPKLQRVQGSTLIDRMNSIERSEWSMSTDLQAVFELLLDTAVRNGVPPEDMPTTLYIISDMEFNEAAEGETNFEAVERKYTLAGYARPSIVFWNVNARGDNTPVLENQDGVTMVSGFSPTVFKMVVEGKTPERLMLDVINSERYASIEVPANI